jgi:peptidoglycan/xylan/chitin deacetylase (PgdA/CDA1 family)
MPTVAITFDDGYADNFVNLRAITEESGLPIGYFISTEHISSGREFAHDQMVDDTGFRPTPGSRSNFCSAAATKSAAIRAITPIATRPMRSSCATRLLVQARIFGGSWGPLRTFPFRLDCRRIYRPPAAQIACAGYKNVFSA